MGLSGLFRLRKASLKVKGRAPGKSVIMQASGIEGQELTPEVYQAPGVFALPPDGVVGVYTRLGAGGSRGIVIALHNYQIEINISAGETALYSTTSDGKTVKGLIKLDKDGNIAFNGNSKHLVNYEDLNTALANFKSSIDAAIAGAITGHTHAGVTPGPSASGPGAGAAPATALDLSAAKTNTLKTDG